MTCKVMQAGMQANLPFARLYQVIEKLPHLLILGQNSAQMFSYSM